MVEGIIPGISIYLYAILSHNLEVMVSQTPRIDAYAEDCLFDIP